MGNFPTLDCGKLYFKTIVQEIFLHLSQSTGIFPTHARTIFPTCVGSMLPTLKKWMLKSCWKWIQIYHNVHSFLFPFLNFVRQCLWEALLSSETILLRFPNSTMTFFSGTPLSAMAKCVPILKDACAHTWQRIEHVLLNTRNVQKRLSPTPGAGLRSQKTL